MEPEYLRVHVWLEESLSDRLVLVHVWGPCCRDAQDKDGPDSYLY